MALFTASITFEVADDEWQGRELRSALIRLRQAIQPWHEVVSLDHRRDVDLEELAGLVGVEWGGR